MIADLCDEQGKDNMDLSLRSNISEGVWRYLGNFGERLMTTQEAKSIGSVIAKKDGGDDVLKTIFITIASYRDWQCSYSKSPSQSQNIFYTDTELFISATVHTLSKIADFMS